MEAVTHNQDMTLQLRQSVRQRTATGHEKTQRGQMERYRRQHSPQLSKVGKESDSGE